MQMQYKCKCRAWPWTLRGEICCAWGRTVSSLLPAMEPGSRLRRMFVCLFLVSWSILFVFCLFLVCWNIFICLADEKLFKFQSPLRQMDSLWRMFLPIFEEILVESIIWQKVFSDTVLKELMENVGLIWSNMVKIWWKFMWTEGNYWSNMMKIYVNWKKMLF